MKDVPVLVLGAGGVGAALLEQLVNGRSAIAARNQIQFNVVAVCDSQSWQFDSRGLSDQALLDIVARKANGDPVGTERPSTLACLNALAAAGLQHAILVDVTAAAGLEPVIDHALNLAYGIVLANKKIFAGPWRTAQKYFNHPLIRYEATVGGGQPVIATLRYLLDTNDPITEISGQLSGSLGFICRQLDEGAAFSTAVAEAKTRGYTEPDPRDDLSGQDVMRKMLILGRTAGWSLDPADIVVESLYPPALAKGTVPEFLTAAAALDAPIARRVAAAHAQGQVLRYLASVENGRGIVGLQAVPAGGLTDLKHIRFRTSLYHEAPLLLGGQGAGVAITAAGVLGDMVDLVREWRGLA